MAADPIFDVFTAADAVWQEAERLIAAVPGAFSGSLSAACVHVEDGPTGSRAGYHFELRGAVPRQRLPGHLLLAFDLARADRRSSWTHGRASLLTCAYAPRYDDGWDLSDVLIGMDGRLECPETQDVCRRHAGGRLLVWGDDVRPWNRRGWLFTVPVLSIDGHEALKRGVIDPVVGMLVSGLEPDEALGASGAVVLGDPAKEA